MRLALVILVSGGVLVALVYWGTRPDPVVVQVAEVAYGRVADTVANTRVGTVKACRRSYLAPAVAGQIARLQVREGDHVASGQPLLEVWNEDLKARLQLARAEVVSARAREEEACLRAAEAKREAQRLSRLRERNLVSEEVTDRAQTEAQALAASCRAAAAAKEVSLAQVEVARAALAQTRLRAPFAGVVAEVNGELGEFITPSPPGIPTLPAIDLIDNTCLRVSAPIDEVDVPGIRPGQPVCISLDAFAEEVCQARVRRIAPYVLDREKQARTVEVEVDFAPTQDLGQLLAGYSADVEIELQARDHVLRVPTEAVLEGYRVYVLAEPAGLLEERRFAPGLSNWEFTEVLSGLVAGELVVTSVAREGVVDGAPAQRERP